MEETGETSTPEPCPFHRTCPASLRARGERGTARGKPHRTPELLARRARVVAMLDGGLRRIEIAKALGLSPTTITEDVRAYRAEQQDAPEAHP